MNKQRENIYEVLLASCLRAKFAFRMQEYAETFDHVDTRAYLEMLAQDILDDAIEAYAGKDVDAEERDLDASSRWTRHACSALMRAMTPASIALTRVPRRSAWHSGDRIVKKYDAKVQWVGVLTCCGRSETLRHAEDGRSPVEGLLLQPRSPKEGIGLRGYGQRYPLVEYKKEKLQLFQDMKRRFMRTRWNRFCGWVSSPSSRTAAPPRPQRRAPMPMTLERAER